MKPRYSRSEGIRAILLENFCDDKVVLTHVVTFEVIPGEGVEGLHSFRSPLQYLKFLIGSAGQAGLTLPLSEQRR